MNENLLILIIFCEVILTIIGWLVCGINADFFNPLINYDTWTKFNWFGVIVLTLILNIIFFLYSIIYWSHNLMYWLFTVGRRN